MSCFHIIEHPLIAHKMSVLRDKETKTPVFRQTLREVAYLMTFAVTQHLDMDPNQVSLGRISITRAKNRRGDVTENSDFIIYYKPNI